MSFYDILLAKKLGGGGGSATLQNNKTVSPQTSQVEVSPDEGYDGLKKVTVNAMPAGTAGTPSAAKGAVNNHSISVTPSVTNTTGYITGGTKTGTAVTVSASELVSGTKSITANGTEDVTEYASVNVNVSGGGTVSKPRKDINFFDYDGTIVESYTAQEWGSVSTLPANPDHDGLTAQGWNYTKAQIDTEVTAQGKCDVGQMYVTSSGATEIDIHIADIARNNPYLGFAVNGTAVIDWGDNSSTDTVTGGSLTTQKRKQHTYASKGDYTIKITVTGSMALFGTSNYSLLSNNLDSDGSRYFLNWVQAIRIGANVTAIGYYAISNCRVLKTITIPNTVTTIGNHAFYGCYSLESITIPNTVTTIDTYTFSNCNALESITVPSGVTTIGSYMFQSCYSLASITIPSGVTTIDTYAFSNCNALESITIPNTVTTIGSYVFQNCYSLASITIPSGVTTIDSYTIYTCYSLASITIPSGVTTIKNNSLQYCYGMKEYHIKPTTPPALANANAFGGMPSDCTIYVPTASLATYQGASGWSDYASKMVGE